MILLVLIALVARVDAAPSDDEIALAVRYANLLTGVGDPDDRDEADEADEVSEISEISQIDDLDEVVEARDAGEIRTPPKAKDIEVTGDVDPTALGASAPDAGQPDEYAADGDAGQRALLEAERTPSGATTDDDVTIATSPAGAVETYEAWTRHPRLSPAGRLDLGLAWRRYESEPMHTLPQRTDEVWLVATWRR